MVSYSSIREAAQIVRSGGLIAFPTDTVYGLGCDPFNPEAVVRLVKAKRRVEPALPVLVGTMAKASQIGFLDGNALQLVRRYWPGPLTVVVAARASFPAQVTGPQNTVGLRIPGRRDTIELIEESGGSIIGTSANITGYPSSRTAEEVMKVMGEELDMIIDGGLPRLEKNRQLSSWRVERSQS